MLISSIEIYSYKGFRQSGEIKLTSGFNVIVGQNNVGKTALLEALSLQVPNKPHSSLETIPYVGAPYNGMSEEKVSFCLEAKEFVSLLKQIRNFNVSVLTIPDVGKLKDRLSHPQVLNCTLQNNNFVQAFFEADGQLPGTGQKVSINFDPVSNNFVWGGVWGGGQPTDLYAFTVSHEIRKRIYLFRAQRISPSVSGINTDPVLAPDAANLPSVLHLLQSNVVRFRKFNENVRTILPDIQQITTRPLNQNAVQINVWTIDPETQREDLAFSLSECGTGIGQILGILYVVMTSEYPRIIIIDEPQSFLHPGAIRKLFEILKRYPQHQYIVSTHSPTVVTAANPKTVVLLRRHENEAKPEILNFAETHEMRTFLSEVGARLSDIFGADNILWVEGQTEEVCFPRIVEIILKMELLGTEIIGVKQIGDLEGRHAKTILEIYQRLCQGRGLLPPALAFSFDREGRTEAERGELSKNSGGLIHFIPRRTYENYLLNSKAVAVVLTEADKEHGPGTDEATVVKWIEENGRKKEYYDSSLGDWPVAVHGAKFLGDLFASLSEARVAYDKVKHGAKLTDWIIQNAPSDLSELAAYLKALLKTESK
jgi:energy-coupling factor transporter ATP-binding protein EcfA2